MGWKHKCSKYTAGKYIWLHFPGQGQDLLLSWTVCNCVGNFPTATYNLQSVSDDSHCVKVCGTKVYSENSVISSWYFPPSVTKYYYDKKKHPQLSDTVTRTHDRDSYTVMATYLVF